MDGVDYASFLAKVAAACHEAGITLSVDVDTPAGECEPRANGWGPWYTRLRIHVNLKGMSEPYR